MGTQKRTGHGIKVPTKSIVTVVQSSTGRRKTTHYRLDKRRRAPAASAEPRVDMSIDPLPEPQVEMSTDTLPEMHLVDSEDPPTPVPKPKKSNVSPNIHASFH
jgi:hypothetical protein